MTTSRLPMLALALLGLAFTTLPSSAGTVVAPGGQHACALAAGTVRCWGANGNGQLGDGSTTGRFTPAPVPGLGAGVLAVASGWAHSCALTSAGAVRCWGGNDSGQLGDGTIQNRVVPVDVVGLPPGIVALAAGGSHTCAVTGGGDAWCWGSNGYGQLGDGTDTSSPQPVQVSSLSGVEAVSAGEIHTCALTDAGAVRCWGGNESGQLGDGTTVARLSPTTTIAGGAAAIAAGRQHTCAVTSAGGVQCWGYNIFGQVGDGTTTTRLAPTPVSGLASDVAAVATGGFHSCALTATGQARCWGFNASSQVGDGTTTHRRVPTPVIGLPGGITGIAAGWNFSFAATSGGGVWGWGNNDVGQLGDGVAGFRPAAVPVSALGQGAVTGLALGIEHSCFVAAGAARCTGNNLYGQLGDGTTAHRSSPVTVSGLGSGVSMLAAGHFHTCALTTGGAVSCWGDNGQGQLGDGTGTSHLTPVAVSGLGSGVLSIVAGAFHTCALASGGAVWCWGYNSSGELGDGTSSTRLAPVLVSGLATPASAITAGYSHTCALTSAGAAYCWGDNYDGQVGNGTTGDQFTPAAVSGLSTGVASIAAGGYHTCAVTTAGAPLCWGDNAAGQLGDGTTGDRSTPQPVPGIGTPVSAFAPGREHTCALTTGGAVWCWGENQDGQLGDRTTVPSLSPVPSGVPAGVTALASGGEHSCALVSAVVWCWGLDSFGQLGLGAQPAASPATRALAFGQREFDWDDLADPAVYRAASGTWFWLKSSAGWAQFDYKGWGVEGEGDVPVRGDFDGDGLLDPTVFRPATGTWFVLSSRSGYVEWSWSGWGVAGDKLVPADYDGDGKADAAVYRPATGVWYIRPSSGAAPVSVGFGAGGDEPVAGDFDGDLKADIAVYRAATGTWFWLKSSSGFNEWEHRGWGIEAQGDTPAPGDYDGDGKTDLCVYRPGTGTWFVLESRAAYTSWNYFGWGLAGDTPVAADYDGDGRTDGAVYRPATGQWFVRPSSGAPPWNVVFGGPSDVPLATIR